MNRRKTPLIVVSVMVGCATVKPASAGPITFVNDYEGFVAAAGDVQTIDFETLPDGSPPVQFIENTITAEFNYNDQGVNFFSHEPRLFVQGTPSVGYSLIADTYPDLEPHNWIIADFVTPAWAVGVFFPGTSYLYAYDGDEQLITSIAGGGSGNDRFLGIVSDTPIVSARIDWHQYVTVADSFHFTPVAEPATLILLWAGGWVLIRSRRRRS